MSRADIVRVLAVISSIDGRIVNDATVDAWAGVFAGAHVDLDAALRAVKAHYTVETRRIMPADIISRADPFAGTRWGRMREAEERRALERPKPELEA